MAICCRAILALGVGIPAIYLLVAGVVGMLQGSLAVAPDHVDASAEEFANGLVLLAIGVYVQRAIGDL